MQSDSAPQAAIISRQTSSIKKDSSSGDRFAIFGSMALFAVILALMTQRHEMYLDEAQAWLVTRDHRNLFDLIHHLRYEVHPALWYLLLYLPTHLHLPMVWMQCINYALSLATAWMILTYRRLPFLIRTLLLYGVLFFFMAVVARNYMLASFLLIGAARCLLAERPRRWTAIFLLALAINTHFFAIPIATGIFLWLYWIGNSTNMKIPMDRLKDRTMRAAVGILGLALLTCFFTLRPAPDVYAPEYHIAHASSTDYLVLGVGKIWNYFVPFNLEALSKPNQYQTAPLTGVEILDAFLTICLWLLALSVLPGRRSRWFMITASLLWMAAVWPTVHLPLQSHCTFLATSYIIALMIGSADNSDRPWLPDHFSQPFLFLLLGMQISLCFFYCFEEWQYPFSGAKAAATWLESSGLATRPLVFQSDVPGPAILGYAGVASAYYPGCYSRGSFLMFSRCWDSKRQISSEELQALRRQFNSAPIVISQWQIDEVSLHQLGLRLAYTSPHSWAWGNEDVFIYESGNDHSQSQISKPERFR
jgi:hypothetical protein